MPPPSTNEPELRREKAERGLTAESELTKHQQLELLVRGRTTELRQAMELVQAQPQRWRNALDQLPAYLVIESRPEVNALCAQAGLPLRYPEDGEQEPP